MNRRRRAALCLSLLALGVASAVPAAALVATELRSGDIILQASRSRQAAAIRAVTGSPFTHVGVVVEGARGRHILEASGRVRRTAVRAFLRRGHGGVGLVLRPRDPERLGVDRLAAVERRFLGRPYDARFAWGDDALYCSELVYRLFEEASGEALLPLPRWGDVDLSHPAAQRLLARRRGGRLPSPEEPLVAPSDLMHSPVLAVVGIVRAGNER